MQTRDEYYAGALTRPRRTRSEVALAAKAHGGWKKDGQRVVVLTVMTSTLEAQLTAQDRCDACGAQAYVRVRLESGSLLFCAHHARRHADRLAEIALDVHDETSRLAEPEPSV